MSHIEIILSFKLGQIRTDQDIPGGTRTDQSYLAYLEMPGVRDALLKKKTVKKGDIVH